MASLAYMFRKHRRQALPAAMAGVLAVSGSCDDRATDTPSVANFDTAVPKKFTRHEGRGGEITIRTPKSWRETKSSGTIVLNLRTDEPGSSVNLQVIPAAAGETLVKTMESVPEELRHEFADFRAIKNEMIFLNDLPAGRLVYEASRSGFHGKLMQIFITRHKKDYILTYTAHIDQFDNEEPVVEQVVASIEIEK